MTSEECYSFLFFLIKVFSPFNFNNRFILQNKNYCLKNINNNKKYISCKYTFDKLSSDYLNKDIFLICLGYIFTEKNLSIYNFNKSNFQIYFNNARKLIFKSKDIINKEIELIEKNSCIDLKNILYYNNNNFKESNIYKLYEEYSHITIGYLFYKYIILDEFKEKVKEIKNSLVLEVFYSDIYKWYRLIELLIKMNKL